MAKVSSKRQITLPIDHCREVGIEPGDQIETFIFNGQITIVKKTQGAAKGILKDLVVDSDVSDRDSLQDTLDERGKLSA